MADLTPNNREEYWLKGMVDGQTTLEPNKRREYWYKEIVDAIGSGGGGGGTGGGVLVCTIDAETGALDKTWKEINDSPFSVVKWSEDGILAFSPVIATINAGGQHYYVNVAICEGNSSDKSISWSLTDFETSSETGYPVLLEN